MFAAISYKHYLILQVAHLVFRIGKLLVLLAGGHLVGDERAGDKDAVIYVAQNNAVVDGNELMVAPIIAHRATCQPLVFKHVSVRLMVNKVFNQVNTLLLHIAALRVCIAVKDVLKEHRLANE